MIEVDIPGRGDIRLSYLVTDYNGTLACDGYLIEGVAGLISRLADVVQIHVVTADTFGEAAKNLHSLPVKLTILPRGGQDQQKADHVKTLGK